MALLDDLGSAYQDYIAPVLGAPKRIVDVAADYYAGLPQALSGEPIPTGELAKEAIYPKEGGTPTWIDPHPDADVYGPPSVAGYGRGVSRAALGFATNLATDPLTYLIPTAGKVGGKVAAGVFAPQLAAGAIQEGMKAYKEGVTPAGVEHGVEALLSGAGAGLAAAHVLRAPKRIQADAGAGAFSTDTPERLPVVEPPPAAPKPAPAPAPETPVEAAPVAPSAPAPEAAPAQAPIDEGFGTKHPETGHKYSNTQLNLDGTPVGDSLAQLAATIPDEHLQEGSRGRETRPHVTVKWGLHTNDPAAIAEALKDEPPATVTFGKTSTFPPSEGSDGADVVKVDAESPDLQRLHQKIAAAVPNTDTHPDYKPHATLAYVKPGLGEQYAGNAALEGQQAVMDHLTLMTRDGQEVKVPLGGQPAAAEAPIAATADVPRETVPPVAAAPVQPQQPAIPIPPTGAPLSLPERAAADKLSAAFERGGDDVTAGLTARPGASGPGTQDVGVNLGRVNTSPQVKGRMAALSAELDPIQSRSTPLTNAEMKVKAGELLSKVTPTELLQDIGRREGGRVEPAEMDALRRISTAYAQRADLSLKALREAEAAPAPDQARVTALRDTYRQHLLQSASASHLATEHSTYLGRALQALSSAVSAADLPESQRTMQDITNILRKAGADPKEAARLTELWHTDPAKFVRDPALAKNRPLLDKIVDFNRASLLSPVSASRVLGGNATMAMIELWRSGAGGVIRGLMGDLQNRQRYPSDVAASWTGMAEALPEALSRLRETFVKSVKGEPLLDLTDPNLLPSEALRNQPPFAPGNRLAELHYGPMKMVAAGDAVMRPLFARAELRRLAAVDARNAKIDPRSPEFQAHQEDFIKRFNAGEMPEVGRTLSQFASKRVMGGDLGPIGKATSQLLASLPLLKLDLPFVRSAFNIGDTAIDLTPAGALRAVWKGSALREKYQEVRGRSAPEGAWSKDEIAGRLALTLLGTTIAGGLLVPAAAMGLITGSGPSDPKENKAWRELGNKPYAIGGLTGVTETIEPLGNVLRMAADYAEVLAGRKGGDSSTFAQLVGATRDGLGSFRFVNNLMLLFKALTDPVHGTDPYLAQHASQLVPATVRNVAQVIDPVNRDTKSTSTIGTIIKPIAAALPGLSTTLPAKRTSTGEESTREAGPLSVLRTFSPIQYSSTPTGPTTPALKEMMRVGYFPSQPKRDLRLSNGKTLSLDDTEFGMLQDAHKAAAMDVVKLMHAPEYQSLPDTIAEGGSHSKEAMLRKTFDRRRDAARKSVYGRLRIRMKRGRAAKAKKIGGTRGTGNGKLIVEL